MSGKPGCAPTAMLYFFAAKHRLVHDQWVASVEAACNVRMIDKWDQFIVWSTLEVSVAFA